MSKIEAGRTTLNPTTFSLLSLLEDLELMFRMRTDAKKLTFALEGLGRIPRYVEGDEGKLRQILINLLGNAVKFTAAGGIVLRIRTGREDSGGIRLDTEVEDTGPGISGGRTEGPVQALPASPERSPDAVRHGPGTGHLQGVRQPDGRRYHAHQSGGKGQPFQVPRPFGRGGRRASPRKASGPSGSNACVPGSLPRRILIADDEELNGAFLSKLLGDIGFETKRVTNGKEAIEVFRSWRPHLILMDLRMPEMDGCEATRRIRASEGGRDVKIVGVSASAFEEDRREALAAGADDFLTKPFREDVLFEKIERLLGVEFELSEVMPSGKDPGLRRRRPRADPAALAALPAGFRRGLRDAVVKADYDLMIGLINEIDGRNEPVARELRGLVERYEYNTLLNLLTTEKE